MLPRLNVKKIQPDLAVVVAYGQIIPASVIYLPKHNSLNVHFSLLPRTEEPHQSSGRS